MKKYILALLLSTPAGSLYSTSSFYQDVIGHMQQMEQSMHEAFDSMFQQMNALNDRVSGKKTTLPEIAITEQKNQNNMVISIDNINADTVNAAINATADALNISAGNHDVSITLPDKNILTVSYKKEIAKEQKENEKTTAYTAIGSYEQSKIISQAIDLNKVDVSYTKNNGSLVITIPFVKQQKKEQKTIPVTIQ